MDESFVKLQTFPCWAFSSQSTLFFGAWRSTSGSSLLGMRGILTITRIEQVQRGAFGTSFSLDPSAILGSSLPSRQRHADWQLADFPLAGCCKGERPHPKYLGDSLFSKGLGKSSVGFDGIEIFLSAVTKFNRNRRNQTKLGIMR